MISYQTLTKWQNTKKAPYDTNVTHHFKTLLNQGFQRCSTIEWE